MWSILAKNLLTQMGVNGRGIIFTGELHIRSDMEMAMHETGEETNETQTRFFSSRSVAACWLC